MSGSTDTGQVLGAATSTGAGIVVLPYTAGSPLLMSLVIITIGVGAIVLISAVATRVISSRK